MKTVAIISEYNPFHLGHAHHLRCIRREFGEDTAIVAIMSGNFTQRGEFAIADAYLRARAAVDAGVQLVLELPFPFSTSSAERFASAGVSIADKLGIVDYLSFGSECGDVSLLSEIAERANAPLYRETLIAQQKNADDRSLGHPKQAIDLFSKLYGTNYADILSQPNNILALEYLRALQNEGSNIKAHTVKREGSAFLATELKNGQFPSARAIRECWLSGTKGENDLFEETKSFLPEETLNTYFQAFQNHEMPVDINRLSNVFLAFLRNILPSAKMLPADGNGGLYSRIQKSAMQATDIEEVIQLSSTKKYTAARIRRLMLYALLGITSSEFDVKPQYAQILAMDERGQQLARQIKKNGKIALLTKPADYIALPSLARHQAETDFRADELFWLAKPVVLRGGESIRGKPYLKRT